MGLIRSTFWTAFVLAMGLLTFLLFPLLRGKVLAGVGEALTYEDPLQRADVAAVTPETGIAGALESADLFRGRTVPRIAVLIPTPRDAEVELARRGVRVDGQIDLLAKLGVPRHVIVEIPAGEGGTTDSTAALAGWCRAHPVKRLLVIVSPDHGTRVRRALERAIGSRGPAVEIRNTRYDPFRAATWWQTRTTARDGIVEIEKLVLDYAMHPF
ncbi:MAG: hypothetical protein ACM3SQ_06750 [Betaproteobacteria bacterium]